MKLRLGFVSNSSSASFIAGVAVISNIDKFAKWLNGSHLRIEYKLLSDIIKDRDNPSFDGKKVRFEGFNGRSISVDINIIDESLPPNEAAKRLLTESHDPYIAWFSESGDDPQWDEKREEYNYDDVELSWFENDYQNLYKSFNGNNVPGVAKSAAFMGAGRDG